MLKNVIFCFFVFLFFCCEGAGNCWAEGYFQSGYENLEPVMERLRDEYEKSDCPQGIQLTHSLGGGTGSGFGLFVSF